MNLSQFEYLGRRITKKGIELAAKNRNQMLNAKTPTKKK